MRVMGVAKHIPLHSEISSIAGRLQQLQIIGQLAGDLGILDSIHPGDWNVLAAIQE